MKLQRINLKNLYVVFLSQMGQKRNQIVENIKILTTY